VSTHLNVVMTANVRVHHALSAILLPKDVSTLTVVQIVIALKIHALNVTLILILVLPQNVV